MRNFTKDSFVTRSTFRNKHVNMRIPFKIPTKSMHGRNNTRLKRFRLIKIVKVRKNSIRTSFKEKMKKFTILNEEDSKFLRDSKNNMTMSTIDKLRRDRISSILNVIRTTRITESTFTGKEKMHNIPTMIARINSMTQIFIAKKSEVEARKEEMLEIKTKS